MIELTSEARFEIAGRGTIYVIDTSKMDPKVVIQVGERVKVNGEEWILNGVEMSTTLMSPPKKNHMVGILVKKP